ncbi:MAG TPA: hypothetical protein V6D02_11570, partial [Candidatus Obscuribacterales bacterium]
MAVSGELAAQLACLAPREVLKKALTEGLTAWKNGKIPPGETVPLGELARDGTWSYASAIAQQLAATYGWDAATVAHEIISIMPQAVAWDVRGVAAHLGTLALPLVVTAPTPGWLTLTLTDQAIAHWLTGLLSLAAGVATLPLAAGPSPEQRGHWPLCDRLQLSLPLLLQWSHARCWTRGAGGEGAVGRSPLTVASPRWTATAPRPCHDLLAQVIRTVDRLAAVPTGGKPWLRQGYMLAQAVYDFEAAVPQGAIAGLAAPAQVAVESTLT